MRPQEGVLWNFWGFSGLSSSRWDQKLMSPLQQYAYCSAAIKDGDLSEDFNKLFESHSKDFAVRQKLAEIFIVQCDFTGKITNPSSVTYFRALQDSQTHTGKTRKCVQKKTSKAEIAWLLEDAPRKRVLISSFFRNSFDFLRNMLKKSPQHRHFTREIAVSENDNLLFLTQFLVDPLPVLESP